MHCASGSTTARQALRSFAPAIATTLPIRPVDDLRRRAASGRVTVIYAARDREHNDAVVLAELLRDG